jgi:hypothetical protein
MSMKGMVATLIVGALLAGAALPGAAVAQDWRIYSYDDAGFAIQFPAPPEVQSSRIRDPFGGLLPTTRYTVRQEHTLFTVSVVNYAGTNADALTTITETEKSLRASGGVTASAGARIGGHHGRALSVTAADGSRSAIAIFFVDKRLYTLTGQTLPPNAEENGDAVRFLESMQFSDNIAGFAGLFGGGNQNSSVVRTAPNAPAVPAVPVVSASSTAPAVRAVAAAPVEAPVAAPAAGPAARPDARADSHTDAACAGKSAGDTVQLATPGGPVTATCILVARPNLPAGATR